MTINRSNQASGIAVSDTVTSVTNYWWTIIFINKFFKHKIKSAPEYMVHLPLLTKKGGLKYFHTKSSGR